MRFPIWRPTWSLFSQYNRSFNRIQNSFCSQTLRVEMDGNVVHDVQNSEFYIKLGKDRAILQYQHLDNNVMDMYHTGVPAKHQGKGLAGHLVKAALQYVVEKDLKILPTCSYVQHYVNKNQQEEIRERIIPMQDN